MLFMVLQSSREQNKPVHRATASANKEKKETDMPELLQQVERFNLVAAKSQSKDSNRRLTYYYGSRNKNKRTYSQEKHHISHQEQRTNS